MNHITKTSGVYMNHMENNAYWTLGMGGLGISIGLLIYGYKMIRQMHRQIHKVDVI